MKPTIIDAHQHYDPLTSRDKLLTLGKSKLTPQDPLQKDLPIKKDNHYHKCIFMEGNTKATYILQPQPPKNDRVFAPNHEILAIRQVFSNFSSFLV